MTIYPEEHDFIAQVCADDAAERLPRRLSDDPAVRLAECRGESAAPSEDAAAGKWHQGCPLSPWNSEWFLAQLDDGSYAVLRPLPEEWAYDFTTEDGTYFMSKRIKRWAQLSDSDYVEPEAFDEAAERVKFEAHYEAGDFYFEEQIPGIVDGNYRKFQSWCVWKVCVKSRAEVK